MFGVFLVMMVALVGGLIAFIGDRVGMRVGRKRLTLFGLRPRYTSILIAILTGVLTAAATLGILSAASNDVRTAVFHLSRLKKELRQTTSRNLVLNVKNRKLNVEYTRVQQDLLDKSREWQVAQAELKRVNAVISSLAAARERAEEELRLAETKLTTTAADLARAKEQYGEIALKLEAAETEVKFIQQRKDNLESAIALMEKQLESLFSEKEGLGAGVVDFAYQPIILHLGEVLVARVVRPGMTMAEISPLLSEMLVRADQIARDRGATIANKPVGSKVDVTGWANAYKALIDLEEPAVVRVVSKTNAIAGKPAIIHLEVLPDAVIFRRGEVIARLVVDVRETADLIFARLAGGLLPDARKAAEAKGMAETDGGSPSPLVTFTALRDAVMEVKNRSGRIEIQLVAARDIKRAGDSLALEVVVAPAAAS